MGIVEDRGNAAAGGPAATAPDGDWIATDTVAPAEANSSKDGSTTVLGSTTVTITEEESSIQRSNEKKENDEDNSSKRPPFSEGAEGSGAVGVAVAAAEGGGATAEPPSGESAAGGESKGNDDNAAADGSGGGVVVVSPLPPSPSGASSAGGESESGSGDDDDFALVSVNDGVPPGALVSDEEAPASGGDLRLSLSLPQPPPPRSLRVAAPGAYSVTGSSSSAVSNEASAIIDDGGRIHSAAAASALDESSNNNGDHSAGDVVATATLVQDGVVANATAVDLEAEREERDRLRRENESLRQAQLGGGNEDHDDWTTKDCFQNRRRQGKIKAALLVTAVVGASAAVASGVAGGLLGKRQKINDGAAAKEVSVDVDTATTRRIEALKAILSPLTSNNEAYFDDQDDQQGGGPGPRSKALDWLARLDPAQIPADPEQANKVRQRYIVALFYFSTGGDGWVDSQMNFLSGEDECRWFRLNEGLGTVEIHPEGVSCDEQGRVRVIALWWNNMTGTLPRELSYFSESLIEINLVGNALSGTLPSELGDLSELKKLLLNENCLSGTVPESITALPSLELAEFHGNKDLTGSLDGFCDGSQYRSDGNLFHLTANCDSCPGSPALIQCDCCICCDIVTYNCCDRETGDRLWNHANIGLNEAGRPFSFDKPCLSEDTLAYYEENKNDLSWITDGRGDNDW